MCFYHIEQALVEMKGEKVWSLPLLIIYSDPSRELLVYASEQLSSAFKCLPENSSSAFLHLRLSPHLKS